MYQYAECVLEASPRRAEQYLETFPGSKSARSLVDRLAIDDCLSTGEMSFKEDLLRAGLYNVLYRTRYRRAGPLDFANVPAIDYSKGNEGVPDAASNGRVALRKLADCTVRNSPLAARELILSSIGTRMENEAFSVVVPFMSSCLGAQATLKFSKSVFRGVLGEALYRLSLAADPAPDKD